MNSGPAVTLRGCWATPITGTSRLSSNAHYDADEDALVFRRLPAKEDWLEVLSQCPVPMDDLAPRRREFAMKRKL